MCHLIEMADKIPDAKPKPTPKPGRSKKPKIREKDVVGLKYFDQLAPLLERLHEDGCQRDTAGNRELHYDQYCMLILLFMFNPIVTSLRGIQQASELAKWRLHPHFEVAKNLPVRMDLAPNGGGDYDERAMMAKVLEPDRLYVTDRGYQKFALFNQIVAAGSIYVCRLRDNSKWEVQEVVSQPQGSEIGDILSDEIVTFPSSTGVNKPDHPIRVI